ncbi:MAG: hypothetical protein R2911_17735 [Caldilineaceae bacterium]
MALPRRARLFGVHGRDAARIAETCAAITAEGGRAWWRCPPICAMRPAPGIGCAGA